MQFHAVDDELHSEEAAVGWDAVDKDGVLSVGDAVLANEVPCHFVEDGGPVEGTLVSFVYFGEGMSRDGKVGHTR